MKINNLNFLALTLTVSLYADSKSVQALVDAFKATKYNFYPAKIFMGDSGSLFLGFIVGSISIYGAPGGKAGSPYFLLAIFVLFLPILDTILAIIRRVLRRKPIFSSDSSHIHHYCLKKGLTQVQTVVCFYVVTFILGLIYMCFPLMRY